MSSGKYFRINFFDHNFMYGISAKKINVPVVYMLSIHNKRHNTVQKLNRE